MVLAKRKSVLVQSYLGGVRGKNIENIKDHRRKTSLPNEVVSQLLAPFRVGGSPLLRPLLHLSAKLLRNDFLRSKLCFQERYVLRKT